MLCQLGGYDLIVCFAVLELLPENEQRKLLELLKNSLNPGKDLIVQYNVYNPYSLRWAAIRILKGDPKAWHQNFRFDRSYLNSRQVEYLFESSGFRIVQICTPIVESHFKPIFNRLYIVILAEGHAFNFILSTT